MSIYFIYEKPEFSMKDFLTHDSPIDSVTEFKIGESKNPVARCKNLQTGNKRRLIIYKTVFCGTKKLAQTVESTIHERYNHKCISGEWYTITKHEIDLLCVEIERLRSVEIEKAQIRYYKEITA
jgi:hypothetical protein